MPKSLFHFILFVCTVFISVNAAYAQKKLSGKITDEQGIGIPFAKIYLKNDPDQRTVTDANGYYEMNLMPDEYFLVVGANGYYERETYVSISDKEAIKDVQLFAISINELEGVEITAKKSNPGREIMLKVVEKRDQMNPWQYAHAVDVYIKATEKLDREEKAEKEGKSKNKEEEVVDPDGIVDPFEEERKKQTELANNMNLVEVQLNRDFSPPTNVKEVRNAYEKRGNDQYLYYTTTVKSNFNFFQIVL